MANLSQIKRQRMLAFLDTIRQEHKDDDDVLVAINEIETELNAKKYGLIWEQHEEVVDVQMHDNIPVFTECEDREITTVSGETYNFILEGDNLHSLRLLEKTHKGKIDVIYIDPPYNTGKKDDFRYNDSFINKEDTFRHSKWLSFMSERLKIARNVLSATGTIFISISDIEVSNVKLLCDEIFGEEHYVTQIPRIAKLQRSAQEKHLDISHDYLLCYSYSEDFNRIIERQYDESKIRTDTIGRYLINDTKAILADKSKGYSAGGDYDFEYNGKIYKPVDKNGVRNRWLWTKERMQAAADLGILVETPSSLRMQLYLDFKFDDKTNTMIPKNQNLIFHSIDFMTKSCYTNSTGSSELKAIGLDLFQSFNNPKPLQLIIDICKMATNEESIVLDFFAGSGTTGHAVMKLNAEDGGNRQFILCTNNENNICEEVTYERIKRVINGYGDTESIPANLKYYRTDFVPKNEEYLSDALLEHIAEMIQLEHGIKLDGQNYIMILNDEEADELAAHWNEYPNVKALYVSKDVLFTTEQNALFKDVEIHIIPDYYFNFELREVGETW